MALAQDDYNKGGFIAFVFSMAFTFLFFIYISFIHEGVEMGSPIPEGRSMKMAGTSGGGAAAGGAAAADVSGVTEPWKTSPAMVAHGKKVYTANCAFCHGNEGKGDGAAGLSLNPKPRNLVEGKWTADGSTIGLFKSIKDGLPGTAMAAFGHIPNKDRWAMVHYIQSITGNKIMTSEADLNAYADKDK